MQGRNTVKSCQIRKWKLQKLSGRSDNQINQGKADAKKQRLALALRENLKKRKAQSRKRTVPSADKNSE